MTNPAVLAMNRWKKQGNFSNMNLNSIVKIVILNLLVSFFNVSSMILTDLALYGAINKIFQPNFDTLLTSIKRKQGN